MKGYRASHDLVTGYFRLWQCPTTSCQWSCRQLTSWQDVARPPWRSNTTGSTPPAPSERCIGQPALVDPLWIGDEILHTVTWYQTVLSLQTPPAYVTVVQCIGQGFRGFHTVKEHTHTHALACVQTHVQTCAHMHTTHTHTHTLTCTYIHTYTHTHTHLHT